MAQQASGAGFTGVTWWNDSFDYVVDRWQRTVLFWDILRQRGNNYLDHLSAGQPPVLAFEYETVLDAMAFDPPVNYSLVRIRDRRAVSARQRQEPRGVKDRRRVKDDAGARQGTDPARPIVVIDPRAGHGPGIGGSKINSQIGVALDYGHPVYFIMFNTDPVRGQTIAAVQQAEIRFLEEVARRHAGAPKPAVIGNCQAGWAAALIGADRPDVVGPMVLNGSPLSYWGGVEGANPMRYKGGLSGGMWTSSLWSDLGGGEFDGAHIVAGFEDLNPANTYWTKHYNLFTKVDTEAPRFLDFEKWWGGFFKLGSEEIRFITQSLFVGNELEKGMLELQKGRPINLKNFKEPIFVFASKGDNITPPPQALNWIYKVYGSVREIKRQGQIIIYMVHENIGHLGIFVSGKIAGKEHREIIGFLKMIEFLAPGLYEMVIAAEAPNPEIGDYTVQFEPRDMSDILAMDDGLEDENAFIPVAAVSQTNDAFYRMWIQPWLRALITPELAEVLRQLHPLRIQRYAWSDINPLAWPLSSWAEIVKKNRRPVSPANSFVAAETLFSGAVTESLNYYRDTRDRMQEWLFKTIYNNPWTSFWWKAPVSSTHETQAEDRSDSMRADERAYARKKAGKGGFAEAVIRIIVAVSGVNRVLDKRQMEEAEATIRARAQFKDLGPEGLKQIIRDQARILSADFNMALDKLASLLPAPVEREDAFNIAVNIALADRLVDGEERNLLTRIRRVLGLHHDDLQK